MFMYGLGNIVGTGENDHIFGEGIYGQILAGEAGDDSLYGRWGDDILRGGVGSDLLDGGSGSDTADYSDAVVDPFGPDGPVVTIGAIGGVTVDLRIYQFLLDDFFQNTGGAGWDRLVGIENLTGTNFNDTLIGDLADNLLSGQGGDDVLHGNEGNDRLLGDAGNDTLYGWVGDDFLYGGDGNDTLQGMQGNDRLEGGSGDDSLDGGRGNDTLIGRDGNDTLTGWQGDDFLYGDGGNDTLDGFEGNDQLDGGIGDDMLDGGLDVDFLNGGDGNDTLRGGYEKDTLVGSGGLLVFDTFDYNQTGESLPGILNRDVVADFIGRGPLAGDQIDLSTIDANRSVAEKQAFIFIGNAPVDLPFTGLGQLRFNEVTKILAGNTTGDALPEIEIELVGSPPLFVSGLPALQGVTDVIL